MNYIFAILYLPIGFLVWGIMCRLENDKLLPDWGARRCGPLIVMFWPVYVAIASIVGLLIAFVLIVGLPLYFFEKWLKPRRDKWLVVTLTKFGAFCKNGFKKAT